MPPFTLTHCTISDAPALAHNNMSAFWTDTTWVLIWRGKTLEHIISQATLRMPHNLLTDTPHRRHQKAVDVSTGAVVGYARWIIPDGGLPGGVPAGVVWAEARVPEVGEERRKVAEREFREADWSYDRASEPLDAPFDGIRKRLKGGRQYLTVHPDHKGQGIATMLVESGIKAAADMGLEIFVLAFKAGLGVYLRCGFKLLEQLIQDDSRYGGKGEYGAYFLVKEIEK